MVDCGKPGSPENGRVFFNLTVFGYGAEYTCNSGYELIGDEVRLCDPNGNWSSVTPRCKALPVPASSWDLAQGTPSTNLPTRSSTGTRPSEGSSETLNLIIGSVIGLLLIIILLMTASIVVLYLRRRRYKHDDQGNANDTTINGTQNSVDNPAYTGQTSGSPLQEYAWSMCTS